MRDMKKNTLIFFPYTLYRTQ